MRRFAALEGVSWVGRQRRPTHETPFPWRGVASRTSSGAPPQPKQILGEVSSGKLDPRLMIPDVTAPSVKDVSLRGALREVLDRLPPGSRSSTSRSFVRVSSAG